MRRGGGGGTGTGTSSPLAAAARGRGGVGKEEDGGRGAARAQNNKQNPNMLSSPVQSFLGIDEHRVFCVVLKSARTTEAVVAAALGMPVPATVRCLQSLSRAGLVRTGLVRAGAAEAWHARDPAWVHAHKCEALRRTYGRETFLYECKPCATLLNPEEVRVAPDDQGFLCDKCGRKFGILALSVDRQLADLDAAYDCTSRRGPPEDARSMDAFRAACDAYLSPTPVGATAAPSASKHRGAATAATVLLHALHARNQLSRVEHGAGEIWAPYRKCASETLTRLWRATPVAETAAHCPPRAVPPARPPPPPPPDLQPVRHRATASMLRLLTQLDDALLALPRRRPAE